MGSMHLFWGWSICSRTFRWCLITNPGRRIQTCLWALTEVRIHHVDGAAHAVALPAVARRSSTPNGDPCKMKWLSEMSAWPCHACTYRDLLHEPWHAALSRQLPSLLCTPSSPRKIHIPGQASVILLLLLLLVGCKKALPLLLKAEFNSVTLAPLLSLFLCCLLAKPVSAQHSSSLFCPELFILLAAAQGQIPSAEFETPLNTHFMLFLSLLRRWTQGVTPPSPVPSHSVCQWRSRDTPVQPVGQKFPLAIDKIYSNQV